VETTGLASGEDPAGVVPEPGDLIVAFSRQTGWCFRIVQSRQLQATHSRGEPPWKGQWRDAKGRAWYVEACRQHPAKFTSDASEGFERPAPYHHDGGMVSERSQLPRCGADAS
jgi:hypothetical protein